MRTENHLEYILGKLIPMLVDLTDYKVKGLPSLRKTIDSFLPISVYSEILDYYLEKNLEINTIEEFIERNQNGWIDISYRLKTEHSMIKKWNKNLGKAKQLREVCNDVIGIRFIVDSTADDIRTAILNAKEKVDYTIDIIDMYDKTKAVDDGYRAIHLYFRDQPSCFPIEIQFWTFRDAILHFYTHEAIYKKSPKIESLEYSRDLRANLDAWPSKPETVELSFETYLYKILHSNRGEK